MNRVYSLPLTAERKREFGVQAAPYVSYAYSYPHKSAYGPLTPPVPLRSVWQNEPRHSLFLYAHIPFCEMRCGFCNLFARAGGDQVLVEAYLNTLERQAEILADALAGERTVARFAVGGGTPTYLGAGQLDRLFGILERNFDFSAASVPTSVEVSPKTATPDRLQVLRDRGVERVSIGVQSFLDEEAHSIGRPQQASEVHGALGRLREFPVLNIDLIYGQPGQTVESWQASLRTALDYRPEELYLYPLYVRPGTGIGKKEDIERSEESLMRSLYRAGRDLLGEAGFEQISMRYFRAARNSPPAAPEYCCQTDGMLGLGCGARSYTRTLHYSSPFAVESSEVQTILDRWVQQPEASLATAEWGCRLTDDDRQRRFVIQSLLVADGLSASDFYAAFGIDAVSKFPMLPDLVEKGLVDHTDSVWRLTALGLEYSDWIGPAFYSDSKRARLDEFSRR
jgi:oxygen-independent coproporphyrinogen-3 oxidase